MVHPDPFCYSKRKEKPNELTGERISYMDGCKVYMKGGWIIVRFSGTEPRVRIMAAHVDLPFDEE